MGSENSDSTHEIKWTIKENIKLYEGLRFHKPLGNNRHFRLMCLSEMLNEHRAPDDYIPMSMIQAKIDELFNLKKMNIYQEKKSIEEDDRYPVYEYTPPDLLVQENAVDVTSAVVDLDTPTTGPVSSPPISPTASPAPSDVATRLRTESEEGEEHVNVETDGELNDLDRATSDLLRAVRDNKPSSQLIRENRRVSSHAGSDGLSEVSAHSSAKIKGEQDLDAKPSKYSRKRGRSQRLQSTRSQDAKENTPVSESKRTTRRSNIKD